MIAFEEARRLVLAHAPSTREQEVPLAEALGLALLRPVRATWQMPRFDQSAVDGYAVRTADLAGAADPEAAELDVIGELAPGVRRLRRLRPETSLRIFTGSPLPRGADAVVMQEHCEVLPGKVRVRRGACAGQNVRRAGEECARGAEVLGAGIRITPPVVALLRSFGIDRVRVGVRPRVTVLTMGDELVGSGEKPHRYAIHDANGPGLVAALQSMGVGSVRSVRVCDDLQILTHAMSTALQNSDVLITAGGASVGAHDHAATVRAELGIVDHFDRVAMKPGKPTGYGTAPGGQAVFTLPGNPVAALVSFQLFVRPALCAMVGLASHDGPVLRARLATELRHRRGRLEWVRARLTGGAAEEPLVTPLFAQGSHMLTGIALADALVAVPAEADDLPAGALVDAYPLRWD